MIDRTNTIVLHIESAFMMMEEYPSRILEDELEIQATNANSDEEKAVWDALRQYVRSVS